MNRSSRQPDLVKNAYGSVDLYFDPIAPKGYGANRIPTVPGKARFAYSIRIDGCGALSG